MFTILNRTLQLQKNDTALKYSDNGQALRELLEKVTISTKHIGIDRFFDDDKEDRIILRVTVSRNGKAIDFRFGMSIHDTEVFTNVSEYPGTYEIKRRKDIKKIIDTLLYSILCCIKSEYDCPVTFDDFCSEFGYDIDSKKAEKTYHALQEQSRKLASIFTAEEMECLPS